MQAHECSDELNAVMGSATASNPGEGCADRNYVHEREAEYNKVPSWAMPRSSGGRPEGAEAIGPLRCFPQNALSCDTCRRFAERPGKNEEHLPGRPRGEVALVRQAPSEPTQAQAGSVVNVCFPPIAANAHSPAKSRRLAGTPPRGLVGRSARR